MGRHGDEKILTEETSIFPHPPITTSSHLLPSYGRKRGRRLRAGKQSLMDDLLPKLAVQLPLQKNKEYWLEIGFGGGEHLAHQAELYPQVGMIGCETYINGIGDLLKHIDNKKIFNIQLFTDDARLFIEKLPAQSVERVFILYPDPWPKSRHHKRRLISPEFLDSMARIMKPGALLRLATDHADYCTWMFERLLPYPQFSWNAKQCNDWLQPPKDWISTRYEQKALAGVPTYLEFTRL